jgi:hypothetical protein
MSGEWVDSEFECCTIFPVNGSPSLLRRLRSALRALRTPVPAAAAIVIPCEDPGGLDAITPTGPILVTVGSGGRIDVGGRLVLGPGCSIRDRDGGGFVIEIPPALDAEIDQALR